MPEADFLAKTPELATSQDYALLRQEGLGHVERLGHERWTDYNVHDPGITFLELLCYGITELGYRIGWGIRDLLTEIDEGVEVNHSDFHTARQVLTCGPVTVDDLRKLLIDLEGVRNAWLEPHASIRYLLDRRERKLIDAADRPPGEGLIDSILFLPQGLIPPRFDENAPLCGLYDVFIEFDEDVPEAAVVGLSDPSVGSGGFITAGGRGLRFDVEQELVLMSVEVWPETAGHVRVRLVDADGEVLAQKMAQVDEPEAANRLELGFRIPPGTGYRLETGPGTNVKLWRTQDPAYPYVHDGVMQVVSGSNGDAVIGTWPFFYAWEIAFVPPGQSAGLPDEVTVSRQGVRRAVARRLHAHRNLCEDFVNVCELETEEVALCADLDLRPDADVEAVLAEIFERVGDHIAPEVRFYSLAEMLARGRSPDEIFAGPPLDHGFIDDDEFQRLRRRCEIRASDIMKILLDIDGVEAIRSLFLLSFLDDAEEPRVQEEWMLTLATDRFRSPVFARQRSKIIFYKNDLPYFASRSAVETLLAEKRDAERSAQVGGAAQDLPVPAGTFRDPGVYVPLQNELPRTFGVGQVRIPASRSALRKAQAKQLKAYLLLFEQLFANHLAQLAHVKELFSWRDDGVASYFTQAVTGIADLEELLHQELLDAEHGGDLVKALEAILEDEDTAAERRGRFLDHLLARFAEDLSEYTRLMKSLEEGARERVLGDKRKLLADYPRVGSGRGQGYDIRHPDVPDNLAGYARRVYRLLGICDVERRHLAGHQIEIEHATAEEDCREDGQAGWRFVLLNDGSFPGQGKGQGKGQGQGQGGGQGQGQGPPDDAERLFESITCESVAAVEVLLDFVLLFGSDRKNYRKIHGDQGWELILECPGEDPQVLGCTTSNRARNEVVRYFSAHGDGAEGFHVIEHILLRKRVPDDPYLPVQLDDPGVCECIQVRDPYTFRATVLLPSWPRRFRDLKFRRLVEDTLRREAPAHVYLKICWISHEQMREFEICYAEWQEQLASLAQGTLACRTPDLAPEALPLTGEMPLPQLENTDWTAALDALITKLHSLVTVHPLARLHDCEETTGDTPQITLNNTSLGTF